MNQVFLKAGLLPAPAASRPADLSRAAWPHPVLPQPCAARR
ncbi:hypothetical protein [Dankookia sp. P2]